MVRKFTALAGPPRLWALLPLALLASCASMPPPRHAAVRPDSGVRVRDSAKAREVVMYAFSLMGIDYRYGGDNPESGLDCSGLVSYVYRHAARIKLPHNAFQIAHLGRKIKRSALRPGDLVFFNTLDRPFSHVGIYIGNGRFIHAPNSNRKITISSLRSHYYARHFEAARTFFH